MARWLFTDARERVECSRCKAAKGERCQTPKGRPAVYPHRERMMALQALPDFKMADYQVRSYKSEEVLKKLKED